MLKKRPQISTFTLSLILLLVTEGCSLINDPNKVKEISNMQLNSSNKIVSKELQTDILAYLQKNIKKLSICEGEIDPNFSKELSSVYPLGKDKYLVEFLCFMGAYQGNYQYLLYQKQPSGNYLTPLELEIFDAETFRKPTKIKVSSIAGFPTYNTDNKILTVITKYRGLSDCGSLAKYQWKNTRFQLLEYRAKEACDGTYIEPENYSQIYP
ncbi:DUF1176 domain-containing protein [Aphanothece sacrum]|nr:DUF1176 domain-containing protein [Aphanothece sacrum]